LLGHDFGNDLASVSAVMFSIFRSVTQVLSI